MSVEVNQHEGSRGFLIGGGPSIKKYKDDGFNFRLLDTEITVGTNKAYLLCNLKYLVFIDSWFWKTFSYEVLELTNTTIIHPNLPNIKSPSSSNFIKFRRKTKDELPTGFDNISLYNNSGVTALRVCYLLGLNPIYLIGVDLNQDDFKKKNGNFHNHYKLNNRKATSSNRCINFLNSFETVISKLHEKNITVVSCSPTSPLNNIIPFKPLWDVFNESK